ncbi:cytochrome P450 [Nitriliruptoraceae bacterium ZYF776]|nr:cytochrome P450 [Profundirhabdus halotolerans]
MREQDPVVYNERYRSWVVTSHEHCAAALRDPAISSDRITPFLETRLARPDVAQPIRDTFTVLNGWLVFKDPPDHTRLRRLVNRAFTPRAVEGMRDRVDRLCTELLDAVAPTGRADLIADLAYPLPAIVVAEMLGVPPEDRDRFKRWSDQISALVFGGMEDPDRYERASLGMLELVDYLRWLLARYEDTREDNLMSALLAAREQDDALSEEEVVATCILLLFGGHETTTNLIANGVLALLADPDAAAAVRDGRAAPRETVEELLRFDGPAKSVARIVGSPTELGGHRLSPGARVFLMLASANRDPAVFERPDELVLDRNPNPHLGFGVGIHYCLGAPLARLEAGIAIPQLLRRFGDLRVVDAGSLRWTPVLLTRGLTALPVAFTSEA